MSPTPSLPQRPAALPRTGLTAVESMLAVAIVAIAGSALLSTLASAIRASRELSLVTVARGLADQLLSEAVASPVPSPSATVPAKPLGPRVGFFVVDHYDNWTESPPQDRFGRLIGTEGILAGANAVPRATALQADADLLSNFNRMVLVEKVAPTSTGWTATTSAVPYRRVTVRVSYIENGLARQLIESSRIVCYVAPSL